MIRIRYTRWDGTQDVRLDPERAFRALSEALLQTDDLRQALDWMLRRGLEWDDVRIAGLDELLERVREEMRLRYRDVNLDHALDEIRERVDELLERERNRLREQGGETADEKAGFLDDLPVRLSGALSRLESYAFEDAAAERAFRDLAGTLDDVRELEDFLRQYGDLFHGERSLGYQDALDLMREMERLRALEEALAAGEPGSIRLEDLRDLLGDDAARDFETLRSLPQVVSQAGYVTLEGDDPALSPRGVRKIGEIALHQIYRDLLRDRFGGHPVPEHGQGEIDPSRTRAYAYGEPLNLDVIGTLRRSLARSPVLPLRFDPRELEVFETEGTTRTSTVLLLDMSWSMSWEGRFAAAKKVTLALETLVRARYPRDYLGIVGFFTKAVEVRVRDLPEISWNMGDPFTNLQDGFRLAVRLLSRHPGDNRQIIVITDGQPTAYFSGGRLYCEWPLSFGGLSMRAAAETLKEVERVTRLGITINTFMLDDSPTLRAFVDRMTRINRGRAFYTRPDQLGEYLLVDYVSQQRKRL